ncbi:heparinase II/III family protein [Microbispora sp. NPDC046973]|uniref:heparinase II/III domain-containing protein n=1 Tax=Microbispora sp. NPDC046973 TaxID=3155022 RepID=UPI0034032C0F
MTGTRTGGGAADSVRGPLLEVWESAASAENLARVLLPSDAALPAPAADNALWAPIRDNGGDAMLAVRRRAETERGTPWPQPLASQYARFFRDGDRTGYESQVFERQDRLTRAVLMAVTTRQETWLDETVDGILLLCEQSSWCWPAHEESCPARGTVLPDTDRPCLDLGAADVAAQLAWADQLLGTSLDERFPGLRGRLRSETRTRVLHPFLRRRDWHWLGLDGDVHNWCPWICGNLLVAALRLCEHDEERVTLVSLAVAGIDRYLAALPPDGSVDEGYEYWWNGACRALEALDVLEHATSGALRAVDVPVVRETVRFPHRMHLGGPWYVNFADARARPPADQPWHVPYRWARRLGDRDAMRHAASRRAAAISASAELGRAVSELLDPHWREAERSGPPLTSGVWLPGTQVGVARSAAGTELGLAVAVKGGHNGEHHNHNDVGSVIVAVDGVPVLVDAGRPTYTAQTFGPGRYGIWTMQSSWHNVPEVRGTPQGQGGEFRARRVEAVEEPDRFTVRMDLAAAYPVPGLERWRRTVELDRGVPRVTVEDRWRFAADEGGSVPSALHFLLAGHVERHAAGGVRVRARAGSRPVLVTWRPQALTAVLTPRALEDPMLSAVWGENLTRLALVVPSTRRGVIDIRVEVDE